MPRYLIQRDIPGVGQLPPERLVEVARTSCAALLELGPQVQWVQSYVTGDRITCVYVAPDAEAVREHARRGGFPADRVDEIGSIIDPMTADGAMWTAPAATAAR